MNVDLVALYGIGVMTLATPCILPLLPIYLGMLLGSSLEAAKEPGGRFRLLTATLAFSGGFALVFTLLGLGASTLGSFLQNHRIALTLGGGALIALFGLKFLGLLRIPWLDRELRLPELKTGRRLVDAALFGVVFALGWTPCVGPLLGSVLTYTASRTADPLTGALYLGVYSLGVASPLVVLSLFVERLLPLLDRIKRRLPTIEKVTGVALVLIGLGLAISVLPFDLTHGDEGHGPIGLMDDSPAPITPSLGDPTLRPRVVEFFRPNCSACEAARQSMDDLRSDCAGRRIEILAVNAEDSRNRELARSYSVTVVPTFVLLDIHGAEQGRLIGAPDLEDLRGAAALLMAETCAGVDQTDPDDLSGEGIGCPGQTTENEQEIEESTPPMEDEGSCRG
jgi:cytochrome c-type biogenesis protein